MLDAATKIQRMELLVITCILLTVTGAKEIQFKGPENTVNIVGSNIALKCSSPSENCNGIDWQKYVRGSSPITIFKGPNTILNVVDRVRYSVNNSYGCDLVIKNAQLTDAGRFICSAILSSNQTTKSANLIILDGHSKCTINASRINTVEGERYQLACEVTYSGANGASMIWKEVEDAPAAVKNGNTLSRSYSIVATAPEVPSFTCVTSFAIETDDEYGKPIGGLDKKDIPNVFCFTSFINVLYSARNVTLSPSLSNYPPGTIVTCLAKGYPSPTRKWQEIDTCGTWTDIKNQSGSQFTMTNVSSKRYRCVAVNIVRGRSYNATSREIQFNNSELLKEYHSASEYYNATSREIQFNNSVNIVRGRSYNATSREIHFNNSEPKEYLSASEYYIGIGIGIGVLATILLATVAVAILVRFRCLEFHPRPTDKSPDMDQQTSRSYRQLSSMDRTIPRTGAQLVVEEEPPYASLGEDRDVIEYKSLEESLKSKPKRASKP